MRRKLIKGSAIITMDPAIGDLQSGDVLIEGDRIVSVAPRIAADSAEIIDGSHMLLLPGLVNPDRPPSCHRRKRRVNGLSKIYLIIEDM